jgi:phospholipid/cholesterol/gamma-HCH transport system substrate-binding protein
MIYNYFAYFFLPNEFIDKSLIYILDMSFTKPHVNWMEISGLLVGIFSAVAVMVFGIVLYAKLFSSGMIGVEEYHLHSRFEKAFGIRPGTQVLISGVKVGRVDSMSVEGDGVKIQFIIEKKFQNLITDSAKVFAMRDQNMIAARVINIDIRRGKGSVLEDNGFLPPGESQDIETVLERVDMVLGRVNGLIDAADTILGMAKDTGTTIGALFGSRLLYDNLNRQLMLLDDITYQGTKVLHQASGLFDTIQYHVPVLLEKVDTIATTVSEMMVEVRPLPQKVDNVMGRVDGLMGQVDKTFGRVDGLLNEVSLVTSGLSDFMEATEQTLQNADDLMAGVSNMWIVKRSMPNQDSVPFMVETLW